MGLLFGSWLDLTLMCEHSVQGSAVKRFVAGLFAVMCLTIAMLMGSNNPLEGTECTIAEIVFASIGAVTGIVTGCSRFFLNKKMCPYCDGKGFKRTDGPINQIKKLARSGKGLWDRIERWGHIKCKQAGSWFKGERYDPLKDPDLKPLVNHKRCTKCVNGFIDVSFLAETKHVKNKSRWLDQWLPFDIASSTHFCVGTLLLIGFTIMSLFLPMHQVEGGYRVATVFGALFGTAFIFVPLSRHLLTVDLAVFKRSRLAKAVDAAAELLVSRRLLEGESSGILGVVGATIASLVAWYVLFREKAKPLPSHRKTIIHRKKRPTFLKNPKPTLGACRRHTCAVTRH